MFPTAGYFRSTNCPFFVHGLCHRPYCHFRHNKPGLKLSKNRTSPHKNVTENQFKSVKTSTPSPDVSDRDKQPAEARITLTEETKRKVETVDNTSHETENKCMRQTNTTSTKSILKRGDEEQNIQIDQLSGVKKSLPMSGLDISEPLTSSHIVGPNHDGMKMSELDSDDYEPPIASLTDEEMKIIGLTSVSLSGHDQAAVESTDLGDISTLNESNCTVSESNSSVMRKLFESETETEGQRKSDLIDVTAVESYIAKETRIAQIKADSLKKRHESKTVEEKNESSVVSKSACIDEKQELTGGKEKSDMFQDKPQRRKSIQLKVSVERDKDTKVSSDVPLKKRKSQQLPCATNSSVYPTAIKNVDNNNAMKRKDSISKQEYTLRELFSSASQSLEHTVRSNSRKSPLNNSSTDIKKCKAVLDNSVELKEKSSVKQQTSENVNMPKRKLSLSETEINFFGPSKKQNKTEKIEKLKKSKVEVAPVKTLKPKILEDRGLEKKKKKMQKAKLQTSTTISSDDSDLSGPTQGGSGHEENDSLRRIWDNFELPGDVLAMEKEFQSPVEKQTQKLPRNRTLSTASNNSDVIKQTSMADALGLGKKQRVAHMPSHLPRRLSSNANPVRRYPKTLTAVQGKDESEASSTSGSPAKEAEGYKPAKHRVAHVLKNNSPAGSLPRPRIPVEYGAKVPQSQRQRYLDRIVDEYLRICSSEKEAFEKAVEEEKSLYERSTRRQVYLNLCVNAIKKLRSITHLESPSPVKNETTTKVAVTKILPSGAVVVSTKSPAKQQPTVSQTDQFTEELMYDFLSKYLMSEDDLIENGYPRPCPTAPGTAVLKTKKQPCKDPTRRTCCRCGKPFVVLEDGLYLTREECVYHAGKLFRRRGEPITNYSCCQGDAGSPGCCVGKVHVSDNVNNTEGFMTTIVSPLADKRKKIFSMDCEMCYTTSGLELTRITVVNWNLEQVYDTFVIPERTIVDYNTRFSGVTEESLHGVKTTIHEVQAVLLSMIHKDTILVGHSLESDLKATKIIHSKVVDTSVVFPHRLGPPYKRALRNLMAEHLKKIIQDSVDGHDSHEDASACLELMRWKVKEDMKKTSRHKSPRQAFAVS